MFGEKIKMRWFLAVPILAITWLLTGCGSSEGIVGPSDEPEYATEQRVQIIDSVNVIRTAGGIPELKTSKTLNTLVQYAVRDLVDGNKTKGEIGLFQLIHNAKILSTRTYETVYATESVDEIIGFLLGAPTNSIALRDYYRQVGVGIWEEDGKYTYWIVFLD